MGEPGADQLNVTDITGYKLKNKCVSPEKHYMCGGIAAFVNVTLIFPFHKTIFFQQLYGIRWYKAVGHLTEQGLVNVYRGILPPLLQRALTGALMFGTQGHSEAYFHKMSCTQDYSPYIKKSMSAVIAGCFEATLMPFERVQTILQNELYLEKYRNSYHAVAVLFKEHGIVELYRGWSPIVMRNCLGNVLYFCGRERIRKYRGEYISDCNHIHRKFSDFATGGLLGAFIGVVTFPLNVVKAHVQSSIGTQFVSVPKVLKSLVKEKGTILRLYRGVPANFMRSICSWGIITMTYEWLMEILR